MAYSGPTITLNSTAVMPQIGFGVWRIDDAGAEAAVIVALSVGYRSLDTASLYRNEEGVARAMRAAADDGVTRDEVFGPPSSATPIRATTPRSRPSTRACVRLGLDWSTSTSSTGRGRRRTCYVRPGGPGEVRGRGSERAIGVSNFEHPHLDRLIDRYPPNARRQPGGASPATSATRLAGVTTRNTGSSPRPGRRWGRTGPGCWRILAW